VRPQPEWLITDDVDHVEVELGNLKTGKEAEIFVIERSFDGRSCLLAHKRYRPRAVTRKGELAALGFQRVNTFMNDHPYRDGRKFAKSRDQRAVAGKTRYGKSLVTSRWTGHELDVMEKAWAAGVNVPYPLGTRGDGMLMQFVGDEHGAAPRLAQARLGPDDLVRASTQLVANLQTLVAAGWVHADLSAYNLLWWRDELWLIDFPQAVDVRAHLRAFEFLHRDLTNVGEWFAKQGVEFDVDELFADLVTVGSGPSSGPG
jgi:RIO kinase 1